MCCPSSAPPPSLLTDENLIAEVNKKEPPRSAAAEKPVPQDNKDPWWCHREENAICAPRSGLWGPAAAFRITVRFRKTQQQTTDNRRDRRRIWVRSSHWKKNTSFVLTQQISTWVLASRIKQTHPIKRTAVNKDTLKMWNFVKEKIARIWGYLQ